MVFDRLTALRHNLVGVSMMAISDSLIGTGSFLVA